MSNQSDEKKNVTNVRKLADKAAGAAFGCLAVFMLFTSFRLCLGNDIWYDELFTEGFVSQPLGRMLSLAARDVHPPLYYIIVKGAVELAHFFVPGVDAVTVSKMVSVIPFLLLLLYSATLVRKRYGWLCAGLFSFCILAMPQLSGFTVEVRMYSWAMFFITAAYFHGMEIAFRGGKTCAAGQTNIAGGTCAVGQTNIAGGMRTAGQTRHEGTARRKGYVHHWAAFILYGICAAYTHYFAAVAAACLYLFLAGMLLWRRKAGNKREGTKAGNEREDAKDWRWWLGGAALSVLAYLPWLGVVVSQVSAVKENYWILPLTWSCFGGCVKFVLKPSTGYMWLDYLLAVAAFGMLALFLVRAFFRRKKDAEEWQAAVWASGGIWILGGTALFGILVSFLMRPIFIYRYMLPALGCFWFCFAWYVSRQKRLLMVPALALLLGVGLADYKSFAEVELYRRTQMERTLKELEGLGEDSVVLFNFDQVQAVAGFYLDQETWLYGSRPEELIQEMFPKLSGGVDTAWIREKLEEGRTVWFVGSNQAREAILAEWRKEGIRVEEQVDGCLLERYWFNLYRLGC